jgi:hypothetical protein
MQRQRRRPPAIFTDAIVATSLLLPSLSPLPSSVNQKNVLLKLISVEKFLLDLA